MILKALPLIHLVILLLCNSVLWLLSVTLRSSVIWDFPFSHQYSMHRLLCCPLNLPRLSPKISLTLLITLLSSSKSLHQSPDLAWFILLLFLLTSKGCQLCSFFLLTPSPHSLSFSFWSLGFFGFFHLDSAMWLFSQISLFLSFHFCP